MQNECKITELERIIIMKIKKRKENEEEIDK